MNVDDVMLRGMSLCDVGDLAVQCKTTEETEKRFWVRWSDDTAYLMLVFPQTPQRPIHGTLRRIRFVEETCLETERELNWVGVAFSIANWEGISDNGFDIPGAARGQLMIEDCRNYEYSSTRYPPAGGEEIPEDAARKVIGFVRWLAEPD